MAIQFVERCVELHLLDVSGFGTGEKVGSDDVIQSNDVAFSRTLFTQTRKLIADNGRCGSDVIAIWRSCRNSITDWGELLLFRWLFIVIIRR